MSSVLSEAYFHDEQAAFAALEAIVWPNGPTCPHCGATDRINRLAVQRTKPSKKHPEGKPVYGLWKCYHCRGQLTCRKGTVFESSHLPLHKWFQAAYLLCSSKKGISSNQLARTLGCTVNSAWFASHRIREAMRAGDLAVPFGKGGGAVESDETFIGRKAGAPIRRSFHHKMKVLTLIDRETRQAKSVVLNDLTLDSIGPVLRRNISREARLMTDEAAVYRGVGFFFREHNVVNHGAKEYVRGDAHTNTAEGYFSVFKRGMKGIYQHCSEKHLHRYLAEFDFRYNNRIALGVNDQSRATTALRGIVGKRLKYKDSSLALIRGRSN
jgi:transposase-like protein